MIIDKWIVFTNTQKQFSEAIVVMLANDAETIGYP